jgi:hypothetical protein
MWGACKGSGYGWAAAEEEQKGAARLCLREAARTTSSRINCCQVVISKVVLWGLLGIAKPSAVQFIQEIKAQKKANLNESNKTVWLMLKRLCATLHFKLVSRLRAVEAALARW